MFKLIIFVKKLRNWSLFFWMRGKRNACYARMNLRIALNARVSKDAKYVRKITIFMILNALQIVS